MVGIVENPTRHKLEEAIHFLREMEQSLQDEKIFSYNLSAFLQATRNITYIMQKQYANTGGFAVWYCKIRTEMIGDKDLKYLKDARVDTVHKKIVPTEVEAGARMANTLSLVKVGEEPPRVDKPNLKKPSASNSPIILRYLFMDHNSESVIEFCDKQLKKLEKIVEECENSF